MSDGILSSKLTKQNGDLTSSQLSIFVSYKTNNECYSCNCIPSCSKCCKSLKQGDVPINEAKLSHLMKIFLPLHS